MIFHLERFLPHKQPNGKESTQPKDFEIDEPGTRPVRGGLRTTESETAGEFRTAAIEKVRTFMEGADAVLGTLRTEGNPVLIQGSFSVAVIAPRVKLIRKDRNGNFPGSAEVYTVTGTPKNLQIEFRESWNESIPARAALEIALGLQKASETSQYSYRCAGHNYRSD